MKFITVIVFACVMVAFVRGEEHEGGEEGHPEQQGPPQGEDQQGQHEDANHQANGQQGQGKEASNGKGEEGFQQGFNQGIKPYSYGYNTGIKPYTYNYYQPLGGKPQVTESGGDNMKDGKPVASGQAKGAAGKGAQQPVPPPMPIPINIDFPDFSAFGLPPPGPQQQQPMQSGAYRAQPQQQFSPAGPSGSTPPPFNYAEYGIPTDVGTATGQANNNSPFNLDNFGQQGQQARPQQQAAFPLFGGTSGNGDDFGIFGNNNNNNNFNNNNNNNGNLPLIPVLEDGLNGNANNVNNNANGGFGIPGIVGPNDFSVAASDFEPLNLLDTLVPMNGYPSGVRPNGANGVTPVTRKGGVTGTSGGKVSPRITSPPLARSAGDQMRRSEKVTSPSSSVVYSSNSTSDSSGNNAPSAAALMAQRRHYKLAVSPSNLSNDSEDNPRSKRSISETPKEQLSKVDPNSAYAILNMDPQYTNPNQGVYSYYPAYNNPL